MSLYSYKAADKQGLIHKGFLEAPSVSEVRVSLQKRELSLISYSLNPSFLTSRKIKPLLLMDLCLHLEQFVNAGIPLKDSLEDLYQLQTIPHLKAALKEVIKDVEGGTLFSQALAKHPSIFDPVFIGLIAAGERTGHFSFVLQQLFHHFQWVDELRSQIFKALRYPFIMGSVLISIIVILMTTLVPELVKFRDTFGGNLPLSTSFLFFASQFLSENLGLFMAILALLPVLFFSINTFHPKAPLWKEWLLDRYPLIGPLRRKFALTLFCHVFGVMFESGIDVIQALQTARKHIKHGKMHDVLETTEHLIQEGNSLSNALQNAGCFPPIVIQMIHIGEKTSSLEKTLRHVKIYFDTILKRQVDHVVGLLEPLTLLCLGGFMAWIIYSVFVPLYDTLSLMDY